VIGLLAKLLDGWFHDYTFEQLEIQSREVTSDEVHEVARKDAFIVNLAVCRLVWVEVLFRKF